nr:MAG TPA: HOLLIDAY JUNCTION RESOLVASE [Caudoviricetes sp.]
MSKIVIGIDQSYTRTGITILEDKKIFRMKSIDFHDCSNNTEKRLEIYTYLETIFKRRLCKQIENRNVIIITERIRLRSQGFLSEAYIKSTGALVATIIDVANIYDIPVYSVDTRSWKGQIVGDSKPLNNSYGINKEKYRTILYMRNKGLLKYIAEPYTGRGKQGVVNIKINGKKTPCKINDDLADSYCIAMYGFIPKEKQKLKEENF